LFFRKSGGEMLDDTNSATGDMLGRVNIGWTVGEEVLFSNSNSVRTENCFSETESCLLGINK